ncbi:MAG: RNA-binding protein [Spirochaetales bacterium]|nr:RNA-binding protein [Spirochaetales bacterium]
MANKVYVGNLSYETTDDELRELFKECGTIASVKIITDAYTGKSRGFAFIEMETSKEAKNAISTLNGRELNGKVLRIDEARENRNRGPRQNYRSY